MTCFNEAPTVRDSLKSVVSQLDGAYEVVIVDNFSTDGTYEALKGFEGSDGVKVVQKRCSRGEGRQCAFEKASGVYIIANMDLDDTFRPFLKDLVTKYHSEYEGCVLRVKRSEGDFCGVTIFPRHVLQQVGGWRDLNWFEDMDVWNRCQRVCRFVEISFPVFAQRSRRSYTGLARARHSYMVFRESLRVGVGRKVTILNWPLYVAAWLVVKTAY